MIYKKYKYDNVSLKSKKGMKYKYVDDNLKCTDNGEKTLQRKPIFIRKIHANYTEKAQGEKK